MAWEKKTIQTDTGDFVEAQAPIIISASRSTDIPAFYAEWFFNRLERGYSTWINPFNAKKMYISYEKTRLIVFWSKNPKPLLPYIDVLKKKQINSYIQFTLNDYVDEKLERGVPSVADRIDTFKRLVDALGFGRVIWRFDPLILSNEISIDTLLEKINHIATQLVGYSDKLVFSFADILYYKKVIHNLSKTSKMYREFSLEEMRTFAMQLNQLNQKWNYALATCGENINLQEFNIAHNKCIDDELIINQFKYDKKLMNFLGAKIIDNPLLGEYRVEKNITKKDKGQREACCCIVSKDIGEYNTCPHQCEYCYANTSKTIAEKNYLNYKNNPQGESITGK